MKTPSTTHYWFVSGKSAPFTKHDLGPVSYTQPDATIAGQIDTIMNPAPKVFGQGAVIQNVGSPTDAQCVAALVPSALANAQNKQIATIQEAYNAQLKAGITATGGGITATLAADVESQNLFTRFIVACMAGGVPSTQSETIFDINGTPIINTLANIQVLLATYASLIKADQTNMLTKIAAVQAATTVEAVQAISYP